MYPYPPPPVTLFRKLTILDFTSWSNAQSSLTEKFMIRTLPRTQVLNPNHVVEVLYKPWLGPILRSPSKMAQNNHLLVVLLWQLFPWWPVLMSTKPPPDFSLGNSSSNFSRNSENFALEWKQIFRLPKPAACSWNFSALKGALVWPFRAKQKNSCVQVSLGWKNTPRCFGFDDRCFGSWKVDVSATGDILYVCLPTFSEI